MFNKLIRCKFKVKKKNRFIKHMLSTGYSSRYIPNWLFYMILLMGLLVVVFGIN